MLPSLGSHIRVSCGIPGFVALQGNEDDFIPLGVTKQDAEKGVRLKLKPEQTSTAGSGASFAVPSSADVPVLLPSDLPRVTEPKVSSRSFAARWVYVQRRSTCSRAQASIDLLVRLPCVHGAAARVSQDGRERQSRTSSLAR